MKCNIAVSWTERDDGFVENILLIVSTVSIEITKKKADTIIKLNGLTLYGSPDSSIKIYI